MELADAEFAFDQMAQDHQALRIAERTQQGRGIGGMHLHPFEIEDAGGHGNGSGHCALLCLEWHHYINTC
ncbi:hypothetical protein GCM10027359_21960 [Marilutibacter aestuarii]